MIGGEKMQSRVYKYPNAIVRVHRPDLAPEERERRMKEIYMAAEKLLRGVDMNDTKRNDPTIHQ